MKTTLYILCSLFLIFGEIISANTVVYVSSSNGDDSFSGLTPDKPVKTIAHAIKKSDNIRLKAGDVFYESLKITNKRIGRYGSGKNPEICGFKRIINPNWVAVGENIWEISLNDQNFSGFQAHEASFYNGIGCIHEYDKDVIHGHRVKNFDEMINDWDIWQDCCRGGNVGSFDYDNLYLFLSEDPNFLSLEFSVGTFAAKIDNSVVENINFIGFGTGLGCESNVTIRNCKIDIIGGKIYSFERHLICYGNGIEFYLGRSKKNCLVEGCLISRCYDSGVTIQGSKNTDAIGRRAYPENIIIRNNLITNCCQGWEEFLNNNPDGHFINCRFENNFVFRSGDTGWGYESWRQKYCHILNSNLYGNKGMIIRNNIFAGGNFINSLFINNHYQSDYFDNNICYITYGEDLVRDPDRVKKIVQVVRNKSKTEIIKEYRNLSGDMSTRFYFWRKERINKKISTLIGQFLNSHSY